MSNLLPTARIVFNATPNLVKTTMSPIMGFLPQRALKDNFVVYFLGVVVARLQIDWSRIDVTVAQEQLYPVGVGARSAKWIAKRCRKACRWILPGYALFPHCLTMLYTCMRESVKMASSSQDSMHENVVREEGYRLTIYYDPLLFTSSCLG